MFRATGMARMGRREVGWLEELEKDTTTRSADPKQRMISWANDKVSQHAPHVMGPTLNMLMRAENRTVTALLNSKNANQTKEIITAAYKRAGLESPFGASRSAPSSVSREFENDVIKALHNQTVITQQIATTLQHIPTTEHHAAMDKFMKDTQESYISTVKALAEAVHQLERRVESWETDFLPHLIDRLPVEHPPSPASPSASVIGSPRASGESKHIDRPQPYQHEEQQRAEEPQGEVNALDRLRDISLRNCCEKVISQQKQQEANLSGIGEVAAPAVTTALKPFRSRN